MDKPKDSPDENQPAAMGGAPVFVQTVRAPEFPKLDRWKQIAEDEAQAAYDMALCNELSGGTPVVREFEKEWRETIGTRYAITVMNGTASLFSAYFGLGVGPGDEVICPTYTWICTISPVIFLGGTKDQQCLTAAPEGVILTGCWGPRCPPHWLVPLGPSIHTCCIESGTLMP